MFAKETSITMFDGHTEQLDRLGILGAATLLAATKKGNGPTQYIPSAGEGAAQIITPLSVAAGEYVTVTTRAGRVLKCATRAKLCLAGGGYVYANESNGAILDTESGPDAVLTINTTSETCDLVTIRLATVHAVLANGIWVLTE